jgi:hypothetical protein
MGEYDPNREATAAHREYLTPSTQGCEVKGPKRHSRPGNFNEVAKGKSDQDAEQCNDKAGKLLLNSVFQVHAIPSQCS